jgi:hypothetical protein
METFSPEITANLEDSMKWNEKQQGYKAMAAAIIEMQPSSEIIEAVVRFTKMKMKDWKESNINLIKEAIALFTAIA